LLSEIHWMEKTKELAERTHPKLMPLLERATLARNEIIREMESEEWKRKDSQEPWRSVRKGCIRTAEEGWGDVVWIGRHLFRRKGWRKETFAKNCADPNFGVKAFAA